MWLFSCRAQQEYPLSTSYSNIPSGSYIKDLNNELDPYVGNWNGAFNGSQIQLFISKHVNKPFTKGGLSFYRDVLMVNYIIKDASGTVLQNTTSMSFPPDQFNHTIYSSIPVANNKGIFFTYGGTNCSVGAGRIIMKKISNTQLSWTYLPMSTVITDSCPPNSDLTIYLPETENLIFTKQ